MARPDREAIDTFMSITGAPEATAIQKLEQYHGNLNEAINAHFSEGDRNIVPEASLTVPQGDDMDIDDPMQVGLRRPPPSRLPFSSDINPFSLLDPSLTRSIFDPGTNISSRSPFVSHPREVREIPIEVKDSGGASDNTGRAPVIEDVSETAYDHGPEVRGAVTLDDDDDDTTYTPNPASTHDRHGNQGSPVQSGPSAPTIVDVPDNDYSNDIEEEMIRAAIEASKKDAVMSTQQYSSIDHEFPPPQRVQSHLEDPDLAQAVSLSLQTAEKEKALREVEGEIGSSGGDAKKSDLPEEMGKTEISNGRQSHLELGSSSIQDEDEDVEDIQLIRHRRRRVASSSIDSPEDNGGVEASPPSSPRQIYNNNNSQNTGGNFPSDEWGGISSEEHDEAVMLEAAMFGGIPEGTGYHFPYAPHQPMESGLSRSMGPYSRNLPRPPSPSVTAQRLIREQQDDEYLAALQADREKELKAKEEAEAAFAEERRKEEEQQRQLQEQQEIERQIAAKEASLPQEPRPDDENAVTLLVRMPDGSRRGRRFYKSDRLQHLFDFIDVGKGVKPGSYRLVRPYPRRAFGDEESNSSLSDLGLTSKQEALYLELI
ncbi:plant UBX domain-containing protein 8 [Andrographis paniculata]|uniref:plant UBX domain-containing protein 8 n=1 Tax=Andrographis paniculata TaxID=175694 RepID=UPI0021E797B1|nr:plant UBX domain-containing protein 8 [Andrographis paniculata]XP_051115110.1 plant UBX domain-containing protein 8 [Andrographis paniculata]XP_051115111.1 plant UBX domain-containing protein 8 [Andrographis paniculata]XP_051115112.1 plant UBX domain-containing protein 8 [Andrographis paniculata]